MQVELSTLAAFLGRCFVAPAHAQLRRAVGKQTSGKRPNARDLSPWSTIRPSSQTSHVRVSARPSTRCPPRDSPARCAVAAPRPCRTWTSACRAGSESHRERNLYMVGPKRAPRLDPESQNRSLNIRKPCPAQLRKEGRRAATHESSRRSAPTAGRPRDCLPESLLSA